MKTINRNNYEKYFLDYIEGTLDKSLHEELQAFLILNPDLKEELEGIDEMQLMPANATFSEKNTLKKQSELIINDSTLDDICVAYYENDLHIGEKNDLINYISKNPEKKRDFELYTKTYLKADLSITYNEKSQLKKYTIKTRLYYQLGAAAAVAALIIVSFILFYLRPITENIAVIDEQTQKQTEEKTEGVEIESKLKPIENKTIIYDQIADNLVISPIKNARSHEIAYAPLELKNTHIPSSIKTSIIVKSKKSADIKNEYYPSVREYAMDKVKNDLLKVDSPAEKPSELSLWDIMQAGINGIENISNVDIDIERDPDKGKIKMLAFNSKKFELSRSFN